MLQNALFDLGHPADPVEKRKRTGSQNRKSKKDKQNHSCNTVTPRNLKGVTENCQQNQSCNTVTPCNTNIYKNHKIKKGEGEQVSLSENSIDAESENLSHSHSKSGVTRCYGVTSPNLLGNSCNTSKSARCYGVTNPKIEKNPDLPADSLKRPLIDRKTDLFLQAIQDMAAAKEDGEELLNAYLPKAKVLLDGGAWWKRASAWTDDQLGKALKDWLVSEETFIEMLETWKEAVLAGCRRMKAAVNRRKE